MPAKQQKDGTWRVVKKDGTLGKRRFSTKQNALNAQRTARANRGGKKPAKGGKKSATKPAGETAKTYPPGVGVIYQASRGGVILAAPLTDAAFLAQERGGDITRGDFSTFRVAAKDRALTVGTVGNLAVAAIDTALDKKTGHTAALSRLSATALIPEVYTGLLALDEVRAGAKLDAAGLRRIHRRVVRAQQGYDPDGGQMDVSNPEFVTYRAIKHGGQGFRKLMTRSRERNGILAKMFKPVDNLRKVFGVKT